MAFLCHLHGHAGLTHVCPHIRSAIGTRAMIPNWLSYPLAKPLHEYVVLRVCSSCAEERALPRPPRMLRDGEIDNLRATRPAVAGLVDTEQLEPMCEACFAARASSP